MDFKVDYDIPVADTFWLRFKGLMCRREQTSLHGLLLKGCPSVHTMFMRFDLQIIYLDENYMVLDTEILAPWKIGKIVKKTKHVYEVPSSHSLDIHKNDYLIIE